jgi:hypothetical protein
MLQPDLQPGAAKLIGFGPALWNSSLPRDHLGLNRTATRRAVQNQSDTGVPEHTQYPMPPNGFGIIWRALPLAVRSQELLEYGSSHPR